MKRHKVMLALMVLLMIALTCCSAPASSTLPAKSASGQNKLTLLQKRGFVTAKLFGVMTRSFAETSFEARTEMVVTSVPITWMGQVFNGRKEYAGPGFNLTDQVHGGASADGEWLLSFSFSRQAFRPHGQAMLSYRVQLKNVPIATSPKKAQGDPGNFEKAGDIQKFVEKIEYTDGVWSNGVLVPGSSFVSFDWTNTDNALRPTLKITLESEGSGPQQPSRPGSGM